MRVCGFSRSRRWGQGGAAHAAVPAPQVCLFFQNQLFRGTRVTKVDTRRFAAFCSPNLPPLAVVGADVISKLRGPGPHGGTRGSRRGVAAGRVLRAEVAHALNSTALGSALGQERPVAAGRGAPAGNPSSEPGVNWRSRCGGAAPHLSPLALRPELRSPSR